MIVIFGSSGQIGQALTEYCKTWHYKYLAPSKDEVDCLDQDAIYSYLNKHKPDYIINLLGFNGGIEFNLKHPEQIFRQTLQLNLNLFQIAEKLKINKVVSAMTSCAYPFHLDIMNEEELYDGPCHSSVECHGLAKRAIYSYACQSNKEYGNRFVFACFNNNYGPGFRFKEPGRLKVCDALIKKFVDAKHENLQNVTLWGDGSARRELLYSYDSASALIFSLQNFNDYKLPILNMGWGTDTTIKALALIIKDLVGFNGDILWDNTKPNGQMKKLLCVNRCKHLGWEPYYNLANGLLFTIKWYEAQLNVSSDKK